LFILSKGLDTKMGTRNFKLGVMLRREHAPEHLPGFAQRTEAVGFDELWVVEDCFYGSGIAAATAALACTDSIRVGLGIMPAVVRNPVFTAMEIATLARLFPERFLPGIGHGVAGWMHQIGAFPKSQLKALEEVTTTVRALLAGRNVTFNGAEVSLDRAELVHPPQQPPPISLGVRGPKSLALSGRVADGTIVAEYSSPEYIEWARAQIAAGQQEAGRDAPHRVTAFAFTSVNPDGAAARQALRPFVASAIAVEKIDGYLASLGILDEAQSLAKNRTLPQLAEVIPDEWIDKLAVAGTPEECARSIQRLAEAGADSVILVPLPDKGLDELDVFARYFL
jgi:5,10-methylenetetrahydromethanopterin reductase